MIELSLKTLAKFDSHSINISLLQFVRQTVCTYLDDDRTVIRKPTDITCRKLSLRVIGEMRQEMTKLNELNENSIHNCGLNNRTSNYCDKVAFMTLADQHRHLHTIIRKVFTKNLSS